MNRIKATAQEIGNEKPDHKDVDLFIPTSMLRLL